MKNNEKERPVGGNQIARAFAWKVADFLADDGEVALFMPAMALYEYPAASFRREFFQDFRVHTVANFSNLEEVLSGGRFRLPAVPFFYKHREEADADLSDDEWPHILRTVVNAAGPDKTVICGLKPKNTLHTIDDAKKAQEKILRNSSCS